MSELTQSLAHARRLMGAHQPLSTVAATTGFADQSHMTRHSKRTFGVTPGAYQRDFRNGARAAVAGDSFKPASRQPVRCGIPASTGAARR